METKPTTKVKNGKTYTLSASGKSYSAIRTPQIVSQYTTTGGEKVTNYSDSSKTRNGLGTATPQSNASGSLKDLSIGLAQQNGALAPTEGSGSIKDLSIGLAKGKPITQEDITRAQSGGASLASLTAPASTSTQSGSPTGATSSPTSNQTGVGGDGYYSRYSKDEEPVVETPNYDDIQKKLAKDSQKEINALYKYQKSLLDEQLGINKQEERATASVSTLTGLAGSSEANVQQQKTTEAGQKANQKIMDAVNVQVQSLLAKVRTDAMQQYQYERTQASQDAVTNATLTEKARKTASENLAALAGSGVTNDGYKQADPEGYAYLAKQMGGEDMVKAMFTLNRPQETILDKKIEGGKYIISFQNPLDGKIRIETVDLGLPPQYTKTIDAGDRILAIPDGWTGDPSELITVNKGLTPSASSKESTGGSIYDMLDFRTANAVISQADKFTSSDVVKQFNNIQDARNNIAGIDSNTQNPADHQAIIYYFAKALDPDSVVREGEYETIKKYSQNIFGKYKGEINNAINGTGFLSQNAIANIKDTIQQRYDSKVGQYQNKQRETARVIDTIAGKPVADMVLVDYEGGTSGNQGAEDKQVVNGVTYVLGEDGLYYPE